MVTFPLINLSVNLPSFSSFVPFQQNDAVKNFAIKFFSKISRLIRSFNTPNKETNTKTIGMFGVILLITLLVIVILKRSFSNKNGPAVDLDESRDEY